VGRRRSQTQRQVPGARIWYDAGGKQNFTAYKPLFTDIVDGRHVAVPRAVIAAGHVMSSATWRLPVARSIHPGWVGSPTSNVSQIKRRGKGSWLVQPIQDTCAPSRSRTEEGSYWQSAAARWPIVTSAL
jgi:hypothetical protein